MANEVAKPKDDSGVPSYLKNYEGEQTKDNFDQSDVVIPRVKLLQGLSQECDAFDDARPGRFWHTGMDKNLGETVDFVVITRNKKYLLVAPLDDGQGILARADDAKTWDRTGKWEVKVDKKNTVEWEITGTDVNQSGLTQWGTFDPDDESSPPAATLFYDYLVLLPDYLELGPVMMSLTRSQIKAAKKGLNDKIELHRGAGRPMQSIRFTAKSINDQSDSGDYKNWQFVGNGFADEGVFKQAMELAKSLTNYRIQDEAEAAESKPKADSDDF